MEYASSNVNEYEFDADKLLVPMGFKATAASIFTPNVTKEIMRLAAQFYAYTRREFLSQNPKFLFPFNEFVVYTLTERVVYDMSNSLAFILTNRPKERGKEHGVATEFVQGVKPSILNGSVESSIAGKLITDSPLGHISNGIIDNLGYDEIDLESPDFSGDAGNYMKIGFISEKMYTSKKEEIKLSSKNQDLTPQDISILESEMGLKVKSLISAGKLKPSDVLDYVRAELPKYKDSYKERKNPLIQRLSQRYSTYQRRNPLNFYLTNEGSGIQHDFIVTRNYESTLGKVCSDAICYNNTEKSGAELAAMGNFSALRDLSIAFSDALFDVLNKARASERIDTKGSQGVYLRSFKYDPNCNIQFGSETRWLRR